MRLSDPKDGFGCFHAGQKFSECVCFAHLIEVDGVFKSSGGHELRLQCAPCRSVASLCGPWHIFVRLDMWQMSVTTYNGESVGDWAKWTQSCGKNLHVPRCTSACLTMLSWIKRGLCARLMCTGMFRVQLTEITDNYRATTELPGHW